MVCRCDPWQGLARLLELLSNWFSVTLGDKLKEHLRRALEPDSRAQQQGGPQGQHKGWKPGEEPKIAAGTLGCTYLPSRPALEPAHCAACGKEQLARARENTEWSQRIRCRALC